MIEELLKGVEVEWKKLKDVCNIVRGSRLTKKQLIPDGKYIVYHGGLKPLGYYNNKNNDNNNIMIINTGSVGEVVWSKDDFWTSDGVYMIKNNGKFYNKFLYYVIKINENVLKNNIRKGGVPTIEVKSIENLLLPIPPIETQKKIVEILDLFNHSNSGLISELEKEIDLRKKQYEYYREKLLTFKNN